MINLGQRWNCGSCGYDLQGLGNAGRCPECGQRFDVVNREGVARADADSVATVQARSDAIKRWAIGGGLALLGLACIAIGLISGARSGNWAAPLGTGGALGLIFLSFAALVGLNSLLDRRKR